VGYRLSLRSSRAHDRRGFAKGEFLDFSPNIALLERLQDELAEGAISVALLLRMDVVRVASLKELSLLRRQHVDAVGFFLACQFAGMRL
jgi:hypothetical protein